VSDFDGVIGPEPDEVVDPSEVADPIEVLERVGESQEALRQEFADLYQGFQRIAGNLGPLLTKQYQDTMARMRVLETRIRNRQERPLIMQMANLLAEVRRLDSAEDVKAHVEEAMLVALNSVGYQEMGLPGDRFDPGCHEPMSGSVGKAGIVTRVHRRGLVCYGDVLIKAMVDVEPAPPAEQTEAVFEACTAEPASQTGRAETVPVADTEQGGFPS
jgi:molecular chaperone GrpE (heat shock protein)